MDTSSTPSKFPAFLPVLFTSLGLTLSGLVGLALVVLYTLPTLGPRWLFFFLFFITLTGLALPIVYFLNRRFPSTPMPNSTVLVRQALWVGIYGDVALWLQMGHIFNLALAVFLAAGLIAIELLLRMRERSLWKPEEAKNE
ncbi:MAG: hypothetical protein KA988_00235 [Longilinea sp.]|nr:hypothetical protein [Longilinea sp.]MCA1953997.1 hypothetical protein [Anaerolinea sp.]